MLNNISVPVLIFQNNQEAGSLGKRTRDNSTENGLSKKKLKKLQRRSNVNFHCRREVDKCVKCPNPKVIFYCIDLIL